MPDKEKNILTTKGFIEEYDRKVKFFPTKHAAFEATNNAHKRLFGVAKYSNFHSFRNVMYKKTNSN